MCGLFGIINMNKNRDISNLCNALAVNSSIRGTHATGISYNRNNNLVIYKRPFPADKMNFNIDKNTSIVMGHTRHATQGKTQDNFNNHPFRGYTYNNEFTLAHNGIIYNDYSLQKSEKLPKNKIQTDSYVIVQLLEKYNSLSFENIATCTEKLQGYYTYTILDKSDNLYIVKGDSPISIIHLKKQNIIVYASTDDILSKSLIEANYVSDIVSGDYEKIEIDDGDILKIDKYGKITKSKYNIPKITYNFKNWYDYDDINDGFDIYDDIDDEYFDLVLDFAIQQGYDENAIFDLLDDGYTLDDICDVIYERNFTS